jgi:hypothetical protein
MVQGDNLLDQGLADDACFTEEGICPPLREAIRSYGTMICLRPSAAYGYELGALAHLVAGDIDTARATYRAALALGGPDAPPQAPGCLPPSGEPPSEQEVVELRANLAAVEVLRAEDLPPAEAEAAYDVALTNYALALELTLPLDGDPPTCYALARELLAVDQALEIDRYTPPETPVAPEDAWLARELAKTCYSRSLMRAEALANTSCSW